MNNIKNSSFKKKMAALALAAVATVVPVTSCLLVSNNAHAETVGGLSIGDKVAEYEDKTVVKDTICVKRWHEYTYTLYYEGTYDNIFVMPLIEPRFVTSYLSYHYSSSNMITNTYNLTSSLTDKVSQEVDFRNELETNFSNFLGTAKEYVSVSNSYKRETALSVTESISYTHTKVIEEGYDLIVDNVKAPYNHYYGDMLMMTRANKFRLHVYKMVDAKYRKSALHKWSAYQIEEEFNYDYIFYTSYYNTSANFYRLTGDLGTYDDYIKLISNEGK